MFNQLNAHESESDYVPCVRRRKQVPKLSPPCSQPAIRSHLRLYLHYPRIVVHVRRRIGSSHFLNVLVQTHS